MNVGTGRHVQAFRDDPANIVRSGQHGNVDRTVRVALSQNAIAARRPRIPACMAHHERN